MSGTNNGSEIKLSTNKISMQNMNVLCQIYGFLNFLLIYSMKFVEIIFYKINFFSIFVKFKLNTFFLLALVYFFLKSLEANICRN